MANPNDWQALWPEEAADVRNALDRLLDALNGLHRTSGDAMVEAAATQWCIEQLETWLTAELNGEIDTDEGGA
jgi:hypothetical protein